VRHCMPKIERPTPTSWTASRGAWTFRRSVRRKNSGSITASHCLWWHRYTQAQGKKLVAECEQKPLGTFGAAQSRINTTDDFMVGELVDGGQGHREASRVRTEVVPGSGPDGATTFSRGDYANAVRWYHRYEGDSTGRTWVKDPYDDDKHDVLNSAEVRLIDFPMESAAPPHQSKLLRCGAVAMRQLRRRHRRRQPMTPCLGNLGILSRHSRGTGKK